MTTSPLPVATPIRQWSGCATSLVIAIITNSVTGNNSGTGFSMQSAAGKAQAYMMLTNSVTAGNVVGLHADTAVMDVGSSMIVGNGTNLTATGTGAAVFTFGNNYQNANLTAPNPFFATRPLQ